MPGQPTSYSRCILLEYEAVSLGSALAEHVGGTFTSCCLVCCHLVCHDRSGIFQAGNKPAAAVHAGRRRHGRNRHASIRQEEVHVVKISPIVLVVKHASVRQEEIWFVRIRSIALVVKHDASCLVKSAPFCRIRGRGMMFFFSLESVPKFSAYDTHDFTSRIAFSFSGQSLSLM